MNEDIITLGGRAFRGMRVSTLEHDHWVMGEVRAAGLDRITMQEGEMAEDFVRRLLDEIIVSGRVYSLLGGLLVPAAMKDGDWTPEVAEDTAQHIRQLTDRADKLAVNNIVVEMLIGFFVNGLATATISRSFSNAEKEAVGGSSDSAEHSTSATGTESSETSPATTRRGIRKYFAGLFARR